MQILIVEDDVRLAQAVGKILEDNDYQVDIVHDGQSGYDYAETGMYDVVILDVMLPKMDGIQVCQRIREQSNVPIIMLTAKGEDMDKIMGLDGDFTILPGHGPETSVGCEAVHNPFLVPFNEPDTEWWNQGGISIDGL